MKRCFFAGRSLSFLFVIVVLVLNLSFVIESWASDEDDYPNRRVEIIVPFAPGQSNDVSSRILAPYLQDYFKQTFVVINKPGAGGKLGYKFVADAKPDGYTIGSMNAAWPVALVMNKNLKYNMDSFIPIGLWAKARSFILVRQDAPWKTLQEFVADAKKNPGKFRWSTVGFGTLGHFRGLDFFQKAGIDLTFISYAGGAKTLNALLGNHIDVAFLGVTGGLLSSGKHLRALAVFDDKRDKNFPDVPTAIELGYRIYISSILGHQVQKGTPKKIVDKLSRAYREIIEKNKTALSEAVQKMNMNLDYSGPEEAEKKVRASYEYFKKLAPSVLKK